eukprot:COSAG02_NODE_521_length_20750_cov_10.721079_14_plen_505_part_00
MCASKCEPLTAGPPARILSGNSWGRCSFCTSGNFRAVHVLFATNPHTRTILIIAQVLLVQYIAHSNSSYMYLSLVSLERESMKGHGGIGTMPACIHASLHRRCSRRSRPAPRDCDAPAEACRGCGGRLAAAAALKGWGRGYTRLQRWLFVPIMMLRHRAARLSSEQKVCCRCIHRCRSSARAMSTSPVRHRNLEPNGVAQETDVAATVSRRKHASDRHSGGLGRVTDWGVPPRHSIAAYLHDSTDHEFPPRWLGASLPALAGVRKKPLQPPPLPTAEILTALQSLQAEREASEGAVVDARRALDEAWKSADSLHAQGVDQQDGGFLNAWWNKLKATSATQWHVADAGDDLLEAKEALAETDVKIWRELHLTKLPPTHYEQVINAGIWECLTASQPPLALTEHLFRAGPPPSLGSTERLSEFFNVDFLRRNELLVGWDQLTAYTANCEREADHLADKLDVDSKSAEHIEAMSRCALHPSLRRSRSRAEQKQSVAMACHLCARPFC